MLTRNHIVNIQNSLDAYTIVTSNDSPSGDTSFNRFSMVYGKQLGWCVDTNPTPNRIYFTPNDMLMSLVIGY